MRARLIGAVAALMTGLGLMATVDLTAASAGGAGSCTADAGNYNFVAPGTTPFYLGVPNAKAAGGAAELKPAANGTTLLPHCNLDSAAPEFAFQVTGSGGVMYLTSRATTPGANVTLEAAPAGPYASQLWTWTAVTAGQYTFQNVKTGLYLRVRNHGARFYDTVSTGAQATAWDQSTSAAAASSIIGGSKPGSIIGD